MADESTSITQGNQALASSGAAGRPPAGSRPLASMAGPLGHFAGMALPPIVVAVVAILGWHLWVTTQGVPDYLVPAPTAVAERFVTDTDSLFRATRATAIGALTGFAGAIIVGFSVAVVFSQSRVIQRSFYPFAVLLQTTPIIAIAPLIIIWVGMGRNAIGLTSFIIAVFPIIANSTIGLMSVEHNLVNLFRMNNATRMQELWKLRVPYAMPYVVAGLKISAGLSVIGAIVGEFFAGQGGASAGLGSLIAFSKARLQTDMLMAAALCSAVLGITLFTVVTNLGNYMVRNWHESATKHEN